MPSLSPLPIAASLSLSLGSVPDIAKFSVSGKSAARTEIVAFKPLNRMARHVVHDRSERESTDQRSMFPSGYATPNASRAKSTSEVTGNSK